MSEQSPGPLPASVHALTERLQNRHTPTLGAAATVVTSLLAMLGSFLPWITLGPFSVSGTEGDGVLTLLLALVSGALAVWACTAPAGRPVRAATWGALVCGALVTLIALYHVVDVPDFASPGFGVFLTLLAGVGLCLSGLYLWKQRSVWAA